MLTVAQSNGVTVPNYEAGMEFVRLLERCSQMIILMGKANSADTIVDDGVALANWGKKFDRVVKAGSGDMFKHGILRK